MEYPVVKSAALEALGTFCMALLAFPTSPFSPAGPKADSEILSVALSVVMVVGAFSWISQRLSGAFFNPFLCISAFIFGQLSIVNCLANLAAEFAGAFAAVGALRLFGETQSPINVAKVSMIQALIFETVFGLAIGLVFFCTSIHKTAPKGVFGFAVPAAQAACLLVAPDLFFSGANPAITLSFGILSSGFGSGGIGTLAGHLIGTVIAGLIWKVTCAQESERYASLPIIEEEIKF